MINYALTRSKRKTIALYIRDSGVEVRAPLKAPKRDIDKFVLSKEKWIKDKLIQLNERVERRENFTLNYGDTALYLGKEYPITARCGNYVGFDDDAGQFYIPPNLSPEHIKAAMIQIYKILAKRNLTDKVIEYSKIMSVTPIAVKINNAKTRWGSCSDKKSLNFSWYLIMADDDVVDYVVVHELAHFTNMDHSKQFWATVAGVIPDYKERQKRLKELTRRLSNEDWDIDREAAAEERVEEEKSASEIREMPKNIIIPEQNTEQLSLFDM